MGILIQGILIFYAILIVVNIPAPFIGLEFGSGNSKLSYAPPGFVIPLAWFVLFTLLGISRYKLIMMNMPGYQWWLFGLAFLCATYAYYTLGLARITGISALWYGLFGNLAVIAFALFVTIRLYPISRISALLVFPICLWTVYATIIVIGELRLGNR